ncbi:MAG: diacylglycerol kinase family protein [Novosphingobium sp.]
MRTVKDDSATGATGADAADAGRVGVAGLDRVPPDRALPDRVPLVGLIRNPRSHRNKGQPPEMDGHPNVLTQSPRSHAALREVLKGYAARGIDYLAVDGGDGTVRDVLTCGEDLFGDAWPTLIILPKGKTNALTVDLGLPNRWSLPEALVAAEAGGRVIRRPLRVTPRNGEGRPVLGFFLGAGAFTLGTEAGQEAHRLGAFNSFAVGLIILWTIVQILFGRASNPWRACTPMQLIDVDTGRTLPHSRHGQPGERFFMVATMFEKFPLGVRPFGPNPPAGLKIGLIDWPLRRLIALLPTVLLGLFPGFVARNGAHRVPVRAVEMEMGGKFIIDGEAYDPGSYLLDEGPALSFVVP